MTPARLVLSRSCDEGLAQSMKDPKGIVGKMFGHWTVLEADAGVLLCRCECGKEKRVNKWTVTAGRSRSCGCKGLELQKKTNKERYGVEYSQQNESVRRKGRETNLKKYGAESSLGNREVREKVRLTLRDRYGVENPMQSKEIRGRAKETNVSRYGYESPAKSLVVKEKAKRTNLSSYGVEYAAQSEEVKAKIRKVLVEKYGVDNVLKDCGIREKIRETNLRKYGVENPSQSSVVKDKRRETCILRHGAASPLESPEVLEKIKKTNVERYGVENPIENKEIRGKARQTIRAVYGVDNPFQSALVKEEIVRARCEAGWRSEGELEVIDFIRSLGFNPEKSYIGGESPMEIDICVKERGFYLEYNGDYWHSELAGRARDYHLNKSRLCREQKGAHLIHIFDSEWVNRKEAVKAFIASKLRSGVAVRASDCEVRDVSREEADEICKYHLQASPNSMLAAYGLYLDGKLLSCITFSRPHRQNMPGEPHLSRFVTLPNYRVHGGLSKLAQHAHKELGNFVTYVHLRLSSGSSYEKAGFLKVKEIGPDYWYWDSRNHKVVSKQSRKKAAVGTPEGMTEREHAWQEGLFRVWDCGKIKYAYKG